MTRRTITTTGTGHCEAPPGRATVEVRAIGYGDTASAAREDARDCTGSVREALGRQDTVPPERVRTVELKVEHASQVFDCVPDADYRAVESLHVDCAPAAAEDVVVVASDTGGEVPHVEFGLHDEVRRREQEEALAAAMERAREKAERIAATEDRTIADVRAVTTDEEDSGMSSIVEDAIGGGQSTDLCPGPITVSETVEVVYELAGE